MLDFHSFLYHNSTENVFFSKKKTSGKCTHSKKCLRIFLKKKAPAGKCTHGNIFLRIFLQKKAPAGKCTHGKNMFNDFRRFLESSPSTIQSSQTTLESSQTTMESSQTTMESSQTTMKSSQTTLESSQTTMESFQSRREDGIGQNRRKKSDYAWIGSWWVQIGSRSRRWDLYRLIVKIYTLKICQDSKNSGKNWIRPRFFWQANKIETAIYIYIYIYVRVERCVLLI